MRNGFFACLVMCMTAAALAAEAPALKYDFKAGQTYAYQLKIEAQTPEYVETLSGQSIYKVKSVDAASGQMTLLHSGTLSSRRVYRQRQGMIGPRFGPGGQGMTFSNYNQGREVVIDSQGGVVSYESKTQLPYLLGSSWGLLIEPLAQKAQQNWQVKRDIEVTTTEVERVFLPPPLARPNLARSAGETIDYTITDNKESIVTIERKYRLATAELVDGEPALEQKGTSIIEFDVKAGLIRSLEGKLTIFANSRGLTVKIPVTVSARLLTAEELAKAIEERKAALAKAMGRDADGKAKAIDEAGVDAALAKLKLANRSQVLEGARTLSGAIPIAQRKEEVARAMEKLLSERDHFLMVEGIKGLKEWSGAEAVPLLIPLVNHESSFVQNAAIDALGALKDERGAEAIARQFAEFRVRHQAKVALMAMGPVCEKYVLPYLKHKEWVIRMEACEILAEAGTQSSVEALKEAARDSNGLVKRKAEDALRAIEGRKK